MEKNFGSSKKSPIVLLPIELGHYRCKSLQDALTMEGELHSLNLKPYTPRTNIDYRGFSMSNLNILATFMHIPKLEDYWANCSDELEVRKKLWSRMTLRYIITFKLDLNTNSVEEDEKVDVLDSQFLQKVEVLPISEVDWTKAEEDNLQFQEN